MPRHATDTSFQPGHKRSQASIERQQATIRKHMEAGDWPQLELIGKPGPNPKKGHVGEKNPRHLPVGTKAIQRNGYIKIKVTENLWRYEHRVIAEQTIGRPLHGNEEVHHLNGDKADNDPENLVVMTKSDHSSLAKRAHGHPRCPLCGYKHPPH